MIYPAELDFSSRAFAPPLDNDSQKTHYNAFAGEVKRGICGEINDLQKSQGKPKKVKERS
jgi:hypothetical protein